MLCIIIWRSTQFFPSARAMKVRTSLSIPPFRSNSLERTSDYHRMRSILNEASLYLANPIVRVARDGLSRPDSVHRAGANGRRHRERRRASLRRPTQFTSSEARYSRAAARMASARPVADFSNIASAGTPAARAWSSAYASIAQTSTDSPEACMQNGLQAPYPTNAQQRRPPGRAMSHPASRAGAAGFQNATFRFFLPIFPGKAVRLNNLRTILHENSTSQTARQCARFRHQEIGEFPPIS